MPYVDTGVFAYLAYWSANYWTELPFTILNQYTSHPLPRDTQYVHTQVHAYTPEMCAAFLYTRNTSELFKACYEHVVSQIFLLSFLASPLFATASITPLVAAVLNNFCSLFLKNTLEIGFFSLIYL